MRPTVFEMDPYVVNGTLSWPTVIYLAVGSALLLAMVSFALWTVFRNRRKGASV
jgi:hypothetical protein